MFANNFFTKSLRFFALCRKSYRKVLTEFFLITWEKPFPTVAKPCGQDSE
jgi:hypothetical protein